jgi:hypothetical protein
LRALTFSGILTDQGLELEPGFVVDGQPSDPEGDLVVQALGRTGAIVAATRLALDDPCVLPGGAQGTGLLARVAVGLVPFPRGAAGLRVSLGGRQLLERTPPRGRLEADVRWPDALSGTPALRWRASEEGCLGVLGYSNDDGRHWAPLSLPTASDSIAFDARLLPGGAPGLLELRVTDGLRTIALRSDPYEVEQKGWTLWILAPADGATLTAGRPVVLAAQAYHVEERRPSLEGIRWSSSADGDLGSGARVETPLSVGEHRITARANGQTAEVAVTVNG